MSNHTILYMDLKRFAVHDGPGIRTTLFLKGCPLRCRWCHNPEGISARPQVAVYSQKCIRCGECIKACPNQAFSPSDSSPRWDASLCVGCGKCVDACLGDALHLYGRRIPVDEAFQLLTSDRVFYAPGGATLSGGEPLLQAEACASLLRRLKEDGIHTAVDTCGAVPWSSFEKVLPYTDIFLYDLKHMDSDIHRQLTGLGNEDILANLRRLSDCGAKIEIRMPIIPGMNDSTEEIEKAGRFLSTLHTQRVVLLPYHSLAGSKYEALGMRCHMGDTPMPTTEHMTRLTEHMRSYGLPAFSPAVPDD